MSVLFLHLTPAEFIVAAANQRHASSQVVLKPADGIVTQRFIITRFQPDVAASVSHPTNQPTNIHRKSSLPSLTFFHTNQIAPGIYKIKNVASDALVLAYKQISPLFVSRTRDYPGDFALVSIPPPKKKKKIFFLLVKLIYQRYFF